jgi:hypothetical protein
VPQYAFDALARNNHCPQFRSCPSAIENGNIAEDLSHF